jgi:hypothetical protein
MDPRTHGEPYPTSKECIFAGADKKCSQAILHILPVANISSPMAISTAVGLGAQVLLCQLLQGCDGFFVWAEAFDTVAKGSSDIRIGPDVVNPQIRFACNVDFSLQLAFVECGSTMSWCSTAGYTFPNQVVTTVHVAAIHRSVTGHI